MVFDNPDNLNQTLLYQRLITLQHDPDFSNTIQQQIRKSITLFDQISTDAIHLMKTFYSNFSEYTLHDETHLLAVANLMGKIVNESDSLEKLSYIEIALLRF